MLHPDTELRKIDDLVGYGVFATRTIPRGTITWALDPLDQILEPDEVELMENHFSLEALRYTWLNASGQRILCWDFGRFVNHSCAANAYGPGGCEFEIAVRDIEPGEQITSDYRTLNLDEPLDCHCGAASCTGFVRPDDLDKIAPACDLLIRAAFPSIREVEQPLWHWVAEQEAWLLDIARAPHKIPSVSEHRWSPPGA